MPAFDNGGGASTRPTPVASPWPWKCLICGQLFSEPGPHAGCPGAGGHYERLGITETHQGFWVPLAAAASATFVLTVDSTDPAWDNFTVTHPEGSA